MCIQIGKLLGEQPLVRWEGMEHGELNLKEPDEIILVGASCGPRC
jgi:hypothetical protein